MEIHSVLPEERARDPKGETLPWGYRYADSTRNSRQPEESGPFGRNRSLRVTGSRSSRNRTGTTPVRQKENTAVAEFGKLFAKEQARDEEERNKRNLPAPTSIPDSSRPAEPEAVATECLLYGYAGKAAEWKVLSKYEKIVAPSIICEDYPREDPNLYLASTSPLGYARSLVVVHKNLSRDALRKSRVYQGGQHWIKITFDSYHAAERACFYSPIEVDGCLVYCEMWQGRGPTADVAVVKGSETANLLQRNTPKQARTLSFSQSAQFLSERDSAIAGFERAMQTLPRSHTMPDVQYGLPEVRDDASVTSTTASSATATDLAPPVTPNLRSRSVPHLPSQTTPDAMSEYMTHIPSVKKAVLRPISEALPPQPTFADRVLGSLPIVSWFFGGQGAPGEVIGEGPMLKDDGSWDQANGWYWSFWHGVDSWLGTDFCGMKDD